MGYTMLFMIEFQPSDFLDSFILCSYKSAFAFAVLVPKNSKMQIFWENFNPINKITNSSDLITFP